MTATDVRTPTDALAPVRAALLARARAEATALLAVADTDGDAAITEARRQAEALRAEARSQGEADAAVVLAAERARTRRRSRSIVLAAQREAYDELRRRARAAAAALRVDPSYPALLTALSARALADLGPDAAVTEHPGGGVVADIEGRRMEYLFVDLADRAVDGLGPDLEGLWIP